jgi:hypothetical protein
MKKQKSDNTEPGGTQASFLPMRSFSGKPFGTIPIGNFLVVLELLKRELKKKRGEKSGGRKGGEKREKLVYCVL